MTLNLAFLCLLSIVWEFSSDAESIADLSMPESGSYLEFRIRVSAALPCMDLMFDFEVGVPELPQTGRLMPQANGSWKANLTNLWILTQSWANSDFGRPNVNVK